MAVYRSLLALCAFLALCLSFLELYSLLQGHTKSETDATKFVKLIKQNWGGVVSNEVTPCLLKTLLCGSKANQSSATTMKYHDKPKDRKCILRHGDRNTRMPCDIDQGISSPLPEDVTVIAVDNLPSDERFWPEIGNGHVATVVKSDAIFMNGLYNGKDTTSHRARVPSPVALIITSITPNHVTARKFVLDLGRGYYYERYDGPGFYVEMRMYAHRVITRAIVIDLILAETSSHRNEEIRVSLAVNNGSVSDDVTWTDVSDTGQFTMKSGHTRQAEYPDVAPVTPVTIVYSDIPSNVSLPVGISKMDMVFFAAVSVEKRDAISAFNEVMSLMTNFTLFSSHVAEWAGLWARGRVDVEGNLTLARINYASLYYITSSLPLHEDRLWPFVGLSPGGLAHGSDGQDYCGHVFWDQDTWMFPPIMMLHADLGRVILSTRIRTLDTARSLAKSTGYKGARYPWESAFTGLETSPSKECGDLEQHITGDVSLAFRQYLQLTNDTSFLLTGGGMDAIADMANFWTSRVKLNATTKIYEIKGVMPPDEYHYPVDNSAYTNTVAAKSLLTGVYAAKMAGRAYPDVWEEIARSMYVPFDMRRKFQPEFDGYAVGTVVKQADVVMLDFPLMVQSPTQVRQNDLDMYEKVTPGGPAMTWGIFTINWLKLGNKVKANVLFQRTMLNAQPPFYIWTENDDKTGAVNFQTGMGGYLQTIIFGYGGFRIHDDRLELDPGLPPTTTRLVLTGIDYGWNSVDLAVDKTTMTITATTLVQPMGVTIYSTGATHKLLLNQPTTYPVGKAALIILEKM